VTETTASEPKRWPTVYVETTVLSYLAAPLSSDAVTRHHQESTRRWWKNRARWDLWVSSAVMIEVMKGDHALAIGRMALPVTAPVRELAGRLIGYGPLPDRARVDAEHIAFAAVNAMDFLVTWNLKHIANPAIRRQIETICRGAGFPPPVICTPQQMLES